MRVWLIGGEVDIPTVTDLDTLLAEVHDRAHLVRQIVEVGDEVGATMAVGLGRPVSVALFNDTIDGPYFASRGDSTDDTEISFDFGETSFYPSSWAIPTEEALAALRQFVVTGERPALIAWHRL